MSELTLDKPEASHFGKDFSFYELALAERNANHPQHQGLLFDEFQSSMANNDVIKTCITTESGDVVSFPQLGPVSQFSWLNYKRYEREFPDEANSGQLLHFIDIPGVEPGDEVRKRVREIAQNEGVLVFDYPANDQMYPERVERFLTMSGIAIQQKHDLAVQTYFAGQTSIAEELKHGELRSMLDIYEQEVALNRSGITGTHNGAAVVRTVDAQTALYMNSFYEEAYQNLDMVEYCNQGLAPEEFMHKMTEDTDTVKIVNIVSDEVVSLLMLDNKLNELSWINADYYKELFPKRYEDGQVMWFPGLAADPEKAMALNTKKMVNKVGELAIEGNNEVVVVFDCGITNTGWLDKALNFMINRIPGVNVSIQPIAQQVYSSAKLKLA